jgi:hypothetical protein
VFDPAAPRDPRYATAGLSLGRSIRLRWRVVAIHSPLKREVSVFKTIVWATDGSESADRALPKHVGPQPAHEIAEVGARRGLL